MNANNYPGFNYHATQLSAYVLSIDTFIIALKDGGVTNFTPQDVPDFTKWLTKHKIRDIKRDRGISKEP